jgi:HlyD family secretion protein
VILIPVCFEETVTQEVMAKVLGVLLVLALGAAALWIFWPASTIVPGILEVSGRVEGDQAAIGARIGGRVIHLPVREGQTLKANEIIAELSSEQAKAKVEEADHDLHTAREQVEQAAAQIAVLEREIKTRETAVRLAEKESKARIREAKAALEVARARLPQAEAERQRTEKDFSRYQELSAKDLIAPQQVDYAKAAFHSARAEEEVARKQIAQVVESLELAQAMAIDVELRSREVDQAKERLREAVAASKAAKARVQSFQARKLQAEADLRETRVFAPFDGTILRRLVQEGQVVAPGTPLVTYVDLSQLYAKVYVAQGELGKIKIDDPARVYTDAFPKRYFEATVSEVSERAEFTPRDVHMKDERVNLVFAVKLAIKNPQGVLKPGMPVDARLRWDPESAWGDGLD